MSEFNRSQGDTIEYELLIDGTFTASNSDEWTAVEYPYDGSNWARVPEGTNEDVDRAVQSARETFESEEWQSLQPSDRNRILRQIADVFDHHGKELAELETKQNGKLFREMRGQMQALVEWYQYYASLCHEVEGRNIPVEKKDGEMFCYTRREPYGVVGAITAWNSPLLLLTWKLAPAIVTGNTIVHKPSVKTPVSALRFGELIYEETDLPEGAYNIVTGSGSTVGDALVNHDNIDKLAFTGSTSVGQMIGATAGERVIPASLELGGKSPNIIMPSANLDNALNGVVKGIFAATGQTCAAGSRVFVHEDIADEFVDRFTERAEDVKLGDPMDPKTQMGPVAFHEQWETVKEYVNVGEKEGATIAFGGERPDDLPGECFIQPTVLVDVDNGMQVAQEEIFGPVAGVITFSSEEEVLELANHSDFGLTAGVWTEDMRQAHRMANALEAGTVWVNEYRTVSYKAPYGGYKQSGLGRENGRESLDEYLQHKAVWFDLSGEVEDPFTLG